MAKFGIFIIQNESNRDEHVYYHVMDNQKFTELEQADQLYKEITQNAEIREWLKQYNIHTTEDLHKVFLGFNVMQEKARKYDMLMQANSEVVKDNINTTKEHIIAKNLDDMIAKIQPKADPTNPLATEWCYLLTILNSLKA